MEYVKPVGEEQEAYYQNPDDQWVGDDASKLRMIRASEAFSARSKAWLDVKADVRKVRDPDGSLGTMIGRIQGGGTPDQKMLDELTDLSNALRWR